MKYRLLLRGICLLSIILVLAIGLLGEEIRNLVPSDITPEGTSRITGFVLENYPLNSGHFAFSLTPAMILFLAMAMKPTMCIDKRPAFWPLFVFLWLLVLIYFAFFAMAIALVYHLLLAEIGSTWIWNVTAILDGLIVVLLAGLCFRKKFRNTASD